MLSSWPVSYIWNRNVLMYNFLISQEFEILSQIRQLQASCAHYTLQSHPHINAWINSGVPLSDQKRWDTFQNTLENKMLKMFISNAVPPPPLAMSCQESWSHLLTPLPALQTPGAIVSSPKNSPREWYSFKNIQRVSFLFLSVNWDSNSHFSSAF